MGRLVPVSVLGYLAVPIEILILNFSVVFVTFWGLGPFVDRGINRDEINEQNNPRDVNPFRLLFHYFQEPDIKFSIINGGHQITTYSLILVEFLLRSVERLEAL